MSNQVAVSRLGWASIVAVSVAALAIAGCGKSKAPTAGAPVQVNTLVIQPRTIPFVAETVGRTEGSRKSNSVHA